MLKNKSIIIIGGAGLIGRQLTITALKNGAHVLAVGRTISRDDFFELDTQQQKYLRIAKVDITASNELDTFFSNLNDEHINIDTVVNCSFPKSQNYGAKFEDIKYDDFCNNLTLHLGSTFLLCQKSVHYFKQNGGGHILNFSSIYGVMTPRFEIYEGSSMTKEIEYIMSKAAIVHFTKYLAKYLSGQNIRVNCICPGGVFNNETGKFLENYNKHCTGKGMLDPEDIVGTFLFLLSDLSKHINGQNIIIDDGFSL